MDLHFLELFRSQLSRLGNDIFRDRQLADIVQQRRGFKGLLLAGAEMQLFADFGGIDLHAPQVIVGGVVLSVDGQGQRFDGAQMQVRHLQDVLLLFFETAQVQVVGAVHQVENGQQEQGDLPTRAQAEGMHESRQRRAYQVLRRRPYKAFPPNAPQALTLGEGYNSRDGHRVHREENDCRRE
jgi:hypothetical protein